MCLFAHVCVYRKEMGHYEDGQWPTVGFRREKRPWENNGGKNSDGLTDIQRQVQSDWHGEYQWLIGIKNVTDSCDSSVLVLECVCGGVAVRLTILQKYSMTIYSLTSQLTHSHNLTHTQIQTDFYFSLQQPSVSLLHPLWPTQLQWTSFSFLSRYKHQPLICNQ